MQLHYMQRLPVAFTRMWRIRAERRRCLSEGARRKGKSVVRKRGTIDLLLTANQFNNSVNGETRRVWAMVNRVRESKVDTAVLYVYSGLEH